MFASAVYRRGGMTLQALREKIGDDAFFRILRNWTAEHAHANATTEQFIDLAQRISGQDLSARPEQLGPEEWVRLSEEVNTSL